MKRMLYVLATLSTLALIAGSAWAIGEEQEDIPPATIVNDEGGPVLIEGQVAYTNPFFTSGLSEPVIILEDQTGFVNRDRDYLFPPESQILGIITSDVFTSPFDYSLSLPIEPQAPLNDVDFDGEADTGVMIFQVAYWTNTFGDVYLEERDQFGGGWSTAYASADTDNAIDNLGEYIGGRLLVYAPDDQQAFPSGFGADGLLFTADDPLVILPQGYTIVDMDTEVFTFDRSSEVTLDLIEGEGAEADDFSGLSYVEAFDAMVQKFRTEYAFTEYYGLDWDALSAEYRPQVEQAQADGNADAFTFALRDFLYNIPDGHIAITFNQALADRFVTRTDGGLGIAIRKLDDERVIVNFVTEEGPAAQVGVQLGAEIISINGQPILDAVDAAVPALNHPDNHVRELQQLRYVTRFPLETEVELTYRNPDAVEAETVMLTAVAERDSFSFSSFNRDRPLAELPVEYEVLPDGFMYVEINSFSDDERLTVQLWERMISEVQNLQALGIIIDMRVNGGGNGFLADQMAAYFFNEPLELGNTGFYDEDRDEFVFEDDRVDTFYLPSEELRYNGPVAVLVGPNCNSACEFFSYVMTINERAAVIGQYPTGGLGGSVNDFFMPEDLRIRLTVGRAVDMNGEIHIEGIGVPPTVQVPVNEVTLFSDGDPVLDTAIEYLIGVILESQTETNDG